MLTKGKCKIILPSYILTVVWVLIGFVFISATKKLPDFNRLVSERRLETKILLTIQGHVTDEAGNPIAGATLTVKWTERQTSSDQNGEFKIENVTEKDTIAVNISGYQTSQFRVERSKLNYFITLKAASKEVASSPPSSTRQKSEVVAAARLKPNGDAMHITGKIFDDKGIGLPDAFLFVNGSGQRSLTNSNGEFVMSDVPINAKITFSQEFTVIESQLTYHRALQKSVIHLDEIVVVGYDPRPDSQKIANNAITQQLLGNGDVIIAQNPEFPGGYKALYKFLARNIKYPSSASRSLITGTVFVSFTINENGNLLEPEIINKIGFGIDQEVLRVVLSMPSWNPARQNGKPVSTSFTMPVNFTLE